MQNQEENIQPSSIIWMMSPRQKNRETLAKLGKIWLGLTVTTKKRRSLVK